MSSVGSEPLFFNGINATAAAANAATKPAFVFVLTKDYRLRTNDSVIAVATTELPAAFVSFQRL